MTFDEFCDNFFKDTKCFPRPADCGEGYLDAWTKDKRWVRFRPTSDYSTFLVEIRYGQGFADADASLTLNYDQLINWFNNKIIDANSVVGSVVSIPNKYYKNQDYHRGFFESITNWFGFGNDEPHYIEGETEIIEWKGTRYLAECVYTQKEFTDDGVTYYGGSDWKILRLAY